MKYYCESKDAVLEAMHSSRAGLSGEEAALRLARQGKNKLEETKGKSLVRRFFEQMMDPMIIILLVAATISGALAYFHDEGFADVIIILAVVIINAILGVYQESKAEKAIEALQEMSAATSRVLRDNRLITIKSEDLVTGDIIIIEAGDAVPADARLIECASIKAEEAALTGESVPVTKFTDRIEPEEAGKDVPLGDRKNMVYMGSGIVYGRGQAVVTGTGMNTEMGKIAGALQTAKEGKTPLQRRLTQLSKTLTWLVSVICVIVFAVQLIRAGHFNFEFALNSFMIAVSLAVAAIPEGLAAVVTVVLSIGVTNMSKRRAIIRKLTAVETLGSAQIICSDKTGTLTRNKMTVVDSFGEDPKLIATGMALCNDAEQGADGEITGEPTEAALVAWAAKLKLPKNDLKKKWRRIGEAPFDSGRKLMSTVHEVQGEATGMRYVQFTKGAPDVILGRCSYCLVDGKVEPMTEERVEAIKKANKQMADKALRVLACAKRDWKEKPVSTEADFLEHNLCFVGLSGMIDPVRPEVREAIAECKAAGIRPVMITGDHIDTAIAIAKDLGMLGEGDRAIRGSDLDDMSDEKFAEIFRDISVYARVRPEHKTRIVNAWRNAGYITAMTGDGVNDAPSIKSADIGVGMGITGTDVTKNVADMVLADDNFATIVGAVEEGRRVYDNILKAIQFLLGSNMSEVISIFVATLMGFTILKPVHLLFINLITDCFPALALGVEKAEPGLMERKPRDAKAGMFSGGMGSDIAYQGIMVSVLVLASYFIGDFLETGRFAVTNSNDGMTMAFLTMSMAEIFHSINMRSRRRSIFKLSSANPSLYLAALGSLLVTTVVCEVPFFVRAFDFTPVDFEEYIIAIALGFLIIPIVEAVKAFQRARAKGKQA